MKRPGLFRFSLGTLLTVVTVLGIWLGLKVRQAERQKATLVKVMGGTVALRSAIDDSVGTVTDIPLPRTKKEYGIGLRPYTVKDVSC